MYMGFKHLHMLLAVLSILGFIIRGAMRLNGSAALQKKWLRIAPHIIDTLLLLTAIGLVIMLQQYPFVHAWLTVKVIGLILYIGLGLVVMRFAQTQVVRAVAYALAIVVFFYIMAVARTKMPLFFLG